MRRVEVGPGATLRERVRVVDYRCPEPGVGEVAVRVQTCSMNRTDIERIKGSYGGIPSTQAAFAARRTGAYVPGLEPAGEVVTVGPGVDVAWLGRRVLVHSHRSCGHCSYCTAGLDNACAEMEVFASQTPGMGGWSEQVVVPAAQVVELPPAVPAKEASCVEVTYGTVWWALNYLWSPKEGDLVVVRGGAGGLGVAAVQIAALRKLQAAVIVRDPSAEKAQALRELGPVGIYPPEVSGPDLLRDFGKLPTAVLELIGGPAVAQDVDLVAPMGTVLVVGAHMGATAEVRLDVLFHKSVAVLGSARAPLHVMEEVLGMVAARSLVPVIDREFGLSEAADAVEYADRSPRIGKVLLRMDA